MMYILLSLILSLEMGSVATEQRSSALFVNPASLGINPGSEIVYGYTFHDSLHKVGLSLGSMGFGAKLEKGEKPSFTTGTAIDITDCLWFGYNYNFGNINRHRHEIGAMFRPTKFISLAVVAPFDEFSESRVGIAVRPFTNRITLFCDGEGIGDRHACFLQYGVMIEPVDGINLFCKCKDEIWKFGMEISFGNLKVGGWSDKDRDMSGTSVIVSEDRYPTFMPRKKKMAELNIKGTYPEMKTSMKYFGAWSKQEPAFYNLLTTIDTIRKRKDISGLFINFESYGLGIAQLEELRKELLKFKATGKKIITFSEGYGFGSYYLASAADYIILQPLGDVVIPGLVVKSLYLKGTMDKLGIEMDIERVGKYKSASEIFERENMSEQEKEQLGTLLDDLWDPMITEIASSRNIEKAQLEDFINSKGFFNSDDALSSKLVDTLAYWDEMDDVLKDFTGKSLNREKIDKIFKKKSLPRAWKSEQSKIAILIAEGSIATGESGSNWLTGSYMGSTTMRKVIKNIEKDKSIKAVVFRVNSGGGSALASEIILRAVKKLSEKKPVIVSMSNVAASGGYYISCSANKIIADRFTLTGSIGVISIFPVLKGLYDKFGLSWDVMKRGEHADFGSGLRHLTPEERERFKKEIEWNYDKFLDRVVEGRELTKAQVDSVAQGRIWSGKSAKGIGLIDEIGGLSDAIELAKKEAKIKTARIVIYPEPKRGFSTGL